MLRPLELWIGLRYTRASRGKDFVSFISLISVLGLVVAITALITVMSVMNGFGAELKSRVLGMGDHASLHGYQSPLSDWPMLAAVAEKSGKLSILGCKQRELQTQSGMSEPKITFTMEKLFFGGIALLECLYWLSVH